MRSDRFEQEPSNPEFQPHRELVNLGIGGFVQKDDRVYRITEVVDFDTAIGVDVQTGRATPLRISQLRAVRDRVDDGYEHVDIEEITDEDWRVAQTRYVAIQPLLNDIVLGRDRVEARAAEVGVNAATLYRWLKRYKACGMTSVLISKQRGWRPGNGRISEAAETVIEDVIENYYLKDQRPTAQKTVQEVRRVCAEKGLAAPGASAVRARIARIPERDRLRKRGYKQLAKNKFLPTPGKFPNADFPLAVVQIDHTPVDIILVDDVYRKPIDRPWITVAIDVHSRMICGYYLSFDPPSETSVAMCIAHAMLPKEDWLKLHGVDAQWPVWGKPKKIHADNGPEFRSDTLAQSCLPYSINLEWRPVKVPRYGGHIERLLGTLSKEIHALPGTTFSSVKNRDGYDSEKNAVMTKSEFEAWLVDLICRVYHERKHEGLGMPPLKKWELGIFGTATESGIGLPERPADRFSVVLDFLPIHRRTVQQTGVRLDSFTYYAEALRPWISAVDKDTDEKLKMVFRRDPRDISVLWFFDPELKQYFKIPFADLSLPAMSIWEYRKAKAKLKAEGYGEVNEPLILRALTELRAKVEMAAAKTKQARKQAQKQKEHANIISPAAPLATKHTPPTAQKMAISGLGELVENFEYTGNLA